MTQLKKQILKPRDSSIHRVDRKMDGCFFQQILQEKVKVMMLL